MRVRIVETLQNGPQTLNAGVLADVPDAIAQEWIAQGLAEAVDGVAPPASQNPALDGMIDAPPARPARRAKG